MDIVQPEIFRRYPDLIFGISIRNDGSSAPPYGLNLSFNVGDDPGAVQRNREKFFGLLDINPSEIAFPMQCHTSSVRYITQPGKFPETDALVTDKPGVYLAITVADCVPVFLFLPGEKIVAAIHAGWMGTSGRICTKTVRLLSELRKIDPENILAYIGPAAGVCCYEVGEEVAERFPADMVKKKTDGKFLLDLPSANKRQLIEAGLDEENIQSEGVCTICSPDRFHSYRRDGKMSGRMMGIIGMRE
jgi:polyphenol oxidase